jgi:Tfp pilus assembly protein PilX
MRTSRTAPPERGSTLVLAMVLLAVLTAIGVAAVALSSQERASAGLKTGRDRLQSCAVAAQGAIWAEMLKYGPSFLPASGAPVPEITLSDGTRLRAGHYGDTGTVVIDTAVRTVPCKDSKTEEYVDLTNRDSAFLRGGQCFAITARCVDPQGRELEVEFGMNKLF